MREFTETEIQNSILEFLRYRGIYAWRQGNHSVYDTKTKKYRRKGRYEINGVSDIIGILNGGRLLAIEVKRNAQARVRPGQKEFIKKVNENGGLAFVAWSIEQVEEKLNEASG